MDTTSIESIDCPDTGEDNPAFVVEETDTGAESVKNITIVNSYETHEGQEEPERQQWSNPVEFLLSCISMSVSRTGTRS